MSASSSADHLLCFLAGDSVGLAASGRLLGSVGGWADGIPDICR